MGLWWQKQECNQVEVTSHIGEIPHSATHGCGGILRIRERMVGNDESDQDVLDTRRRRCGAAKMNPTEKQFYLNCAAPKAISDQFARGLNGEVDIMNTLYAAQHR
jgi:hypothetical protein